MKLSTDELRAIAAEWRAARRVYRVYQAIAQQASLEIPPSAELDSPIDRAELEALQSVRGWLTAAEAVIQVADLRVFCQTSPVAGEAILRALLVRHLGKSEKTESDRDKVDFLLVQYFASCAPDSMLREDLRVNEVAKVLEPVIGRAELEIPVWLSPLDDVLQRLRECSSLKDLLRKGLLYQERKIKQATDEMYFTPAVMVSFARFNFLVRRVFFRLLHAEVSAIRATVSELEARGISSIDLSRAGISTSEPPASARTAVARWREPLRDEYSYGHSLEVYTTLRDAVEAALAAAPVARAAAASASTADAEFGSASETSRAESNASLDRGLETGYSNDDLCFVERDPTPEPASDSRSVLADFAAVQAELAEQLRTVQTDEKVMTRIVLGGQRVLLSSWEVRAFVSAKEQFAEAMRRGVAARVLLAREVERARDHDPVDLVSVIEVAKSEAAVLQGHVAQAREARDIDAAVTLAATSKRLTQLLDEANKLKREAGA